ncbi:MAG: hypothetical protein JWN72_122 [Thermoleophilia bacterium]|nr:hypothetical protein [Thermoleophilia bacterium]
MPTNRWIRRAIATGVLAAVCLVLPSAAGAATPAIDLDTTAGASAPAGTTIPYQVLLDATGGGSLLAGGVELTAGPDGLTVVGTPVATSVGANAALVTCDDGIASCGVDAGFVAGDPVTIEFQVALSAVYLNDYTLTATGSGGFDIAGADPVAVVDVLGSRIGFSTDLGCGCTAPVAGPTTTKDVVLTVSNDGNEAATSLVVKVLGLGAGHGTATIQPNAFCTPGAGSTCTISSLAGGSAHVDIPIHMTGLTATGQAGFNVTVDSKVGAGEDFGAADGEFRFRVSDGTFTEPKLSFRSNMVLAHAGVDATFTADLLNTGTQPLRDGTITVQAGGTSHTGSIVGAGSNVGPCTRGGLGSDMYECDVAFLAVGGRATFTITANWAGASPASAYLGIAYDSASDVTSFATDQALALVLMNRTDVTDVDIDAASPVTSTIGVASTQTVTVNNHSAVTALGISVAGSLRGASASYGPLPGNCAGTATSIVCTINTLAPGASASITLPIVAQAVGTVRTTYTAFAGPVEVNGDDNVVGASWNALAPIVAPTVTPTPTTPAVTPFAPTFLKTKSTPIAAAIKSGLSFTLTTDRANTAATRLYVNHATAVKLGLARKSARGNVLVGAKTVTSKAGGKVVVKVALTAKAKTALKKSKVAVTLIATTIVTPADRVAAVSFTHNVVLTAPTRKK